MGLWLKKKKHNYLISFPRNLHFHYILNENKEGKGNLKRFRLILKGDR